MSTKKKGVKNLIGGKTSSPDHSNKSKKNTSFHLKYVQQLLCCPNINASLFHHKQRSNSSGLHPLNPSDSPTGGNDGEAGADSKSPASGSLQQFCGVINVQKLPSR